MIPPVAITRVVESAAKEGAPSDGRLLELIKHELATRPLIKARHKEVTNYTPELDTALLRRLAADPSADRYVRDRNYSFQKELERLTADPSAEPVIKLRVDHMIEGILDWLEPGRRRDWLEVELADHVKPEARGEEELVGGLVQAVRALVARGATGLEIGLEFAKMSDAEIRDLGHRAFSRMRTSDAPVFAFGSLVRRVLMFDLSDSSPSAQASTAKSRQAPLGSIEGLEFLTEGLVASRGGIPSSDAVSALTPEQRAVWFARLRDWHKRLFTTICENAARRIDDLATDGERRGEPVTVAPYDPHQLGVFVTGGDNAETMAAIARVRATAARDPLAQTSSCARTAYNSQSEVFPGNFYGRIPVGDFGPELSIALLEAARLAMPVSEAAAEPMRGETIGGMSLIGNMERIAAEGIMSIAQTIGLLLAKRPSDPVGDDVYAALDALKNSRLVTQTAAIAPLGVVAPMAATGLVPSEPIDLLPRADKLRARLPAGFEALLNDVQAARHIALRGDLSQLAEGDHRYETGLGCPVAGRGPVFGPDGTPAMSDQAGLTMMSDAFIDLVKRVLAARAVQ